MQVANEMKEYNIEVLRISETSWKGAGSVTLQSGEKLVYRRNDEMQQGRVAIRMSERAKGALTEWTLISKRIITARFYSKHKKRTVVDAYARTTDAMGEEKDEFYNQLQDKVSEMIRF